MKRTDEYINLQQLSRRLYSGSFRYVVRFEGDFVKGVEEDFHEECSEIVGRLEHIKSLLIKIANPEYEKDLNLLERCGFIKSRVKYTEHNSYRACEVSEQGAALVRKLRPPRMLQLSQSAAKTLKEGEELLEQDLNT